MNAKNALISFIFLAVLQGCAAPKLTQVSADAPEKQINTPEKSAQIRAEKSK